MGVFPLAEKTIIRRTSSREGCGVGLAPKSVLAEIKKDLESHIGEKIKLKANKGRKKVMEREGVLEKTYPSIFIIKIDEADAGERRISYSYADLLTESVELVVCAAGGQEIKIDCHSR
jgi:uncharacterized protein Veg